MFLDMDDTAAIDRFFAMVEDSIQEYAALPEEERKAIDSITRRKTTHNAHEFMVRCVWPITGPMGGIGIVSTYELLPP